MIFKYKEIFKLRDMLDKENINYLLYDRSCLNYNDERLNYIQFQIIILKDNKRLISVVEGDYTYGGIDDLLEIMGCLTEEELKVDNVVGYLTAEEVFNRIKKNI